MKKLLMAAVALSLMTAPCLFSTEANAANTAPATVASGTKAPKASKASKAKAPAKAKKVSAQSRQDKEISCKEKDAGNLILAVKKAG